MIANKKKFKPPRQKPGVNKRGRLIIRNLPFAATEETLKNHFDPYGSINDLKILKKPDGKLIGCGFVQFDRKQSAAKAIHYLSGKPFLGRPIIVDWAISKNKFATVNNTVKPKDEPRDVKDEPLDVEVENEPLDTENKNNDFSIDTDGKLSDDDESKSDSESIISDKSIKSEPKEVEEPTEQRPRPAASHDINEGKTVFLKNVPFNCTNDELKAFMGEIGPVYYAVVCIDPLTEHSRGTAFVKFKNREDALKCTEGNLELNFKNHNMLALPALEKNNLMKQERQNHPDKKKDSRNLYLIKEGVVIAGTKAAIGVSMADMKKRLELEAWKTDILRNLNMFVSRTRLIIHNLPLSYDDKKLRILFKKYAPPKSRITEAKVMRNMRQLDKDNKPISKGYGFVSFTEHEHALPALRSINNNPDIFNKNKRPIVAFSIENRSVHNIRQKRMEKSRLNNNLCPAEKKPQPQDGRNTRQEKFKKRSRSENIPTFAGIEAHAGSTVMLPSRRKIAQQGAVHKLNIDQSKKDKRKKKFVEQTRKEKKRDPKVKSKKKKKGNINEKEFSQLVSKYKKQLNPSMSLKKWYEAE